MALSKTRQDVLADVPGRLPGSDAERRAANTLAAALQQARHDTHVQPFSVWPRFGLTHALLAVTAIVGSVVAVSSPAPGAAVVGVATVLAVLDLTGVAMPVRRLFGRRASQNVEFSEPESAAGTLVLVAAYDSPRDSGAMRLAYRATRNPWAVLVVSMAALLICCGLRLAGIEGTAVTIAQFVPTVALILLTPALVDIELSKAGPDPAGAAAATTALALADDLDGALEHFRLRVVLTGATQPFALGMRRWLRDHRKELNREATAVVVIGPCGDGPVHYSRREGAPLAQRSHGDLLRLAREVAEDAGDPAEATVTREVTNMSRARGWRLPAITVATAGSAPADAEALERLRAFTRELIERLDAEIGPSLRV